VKVFEISENMLLKSLKANGYPIYNYSNVCFHLKDWEAKHNLINQIRALKNFGKILLTRKPDLLKYEKERENLCRRLINRIRR
jgi:hypothetical protein